MTTKEPTLIDARQKKSNFKGIVNITTAAIKSSYRFNPSKRNGIQTSISKQVNVNNDISGA